MPRAPDIEARLVIDARELRKQFRVPVREAGLRSSARSLVRRSHRIISAVDGIDLQITRGEVVGFLGPNGAGKTTTLKMLVGLLRPSGGHVQVLGHEPQRRDRDFLRRISLVMGQRQQLMWDLPAADSYLMIRAFYGLDHRAWRARLDELTDLLDLGPLIDKPVRQLSLGERMRCELAAGLLHDPELLLLDEPTLGLDVQAQRRVREFIAAYAQRSGATVLLTSHYMADIEALCRRVVVIDHGMLQFDGELRELAARMSDRKLVSLRFEQGREELVEVPRAELRARMHELLARPGVVDFTVEDEPIERVLERVFDSGAHG